MTKELVLIHWRHSHCCDLPAEDYFSIGVKARLCVSEELSPKGNCFEADRIKL